MTESEVKDILDFYAAKINSPEFSADDPVQFPRRFTDVRDCEIAALLAATIAWGKRSMIIRDAERMFSLMEWQPYKYMIDEGYEDLPPQMNLHRTFFARNLQHWLRGLRRIYIRFDSLDDFASKIGVGQYEYPAVKLAEAINAELEAADGGLCDSRCLPLNLQTTALKRLNMALRWLVRNDGIVDLGLWHSVKPTQLRIPLDVHVGRTARQLGLLERNAADRRAVEQLTGRLRQFDSADPVRYDFALFGLGVASIDPLA